ncbi:phosphate acetyltransferase [Ignavibacteria bacterium]|nr:phosphate acetyltransferase [Bacteroidota bacterium]MCZ2132003.1 phosphate acetyltransferase [Bacteroidota bacterium]
MSDFLQKLISAAALRNARVAFPDAADGRTLRAAAELSARNIAHPVLIGNTKQIKELSENEGVAIDNLQIVEPVASERFDEYVSAFEEKRRYKGISLDESRKTMLDPLYFAGMMLDGGETDCCVAGSYSTTGNVLRAAITTVGLCPNRETVSSYFLMLLADGQLMAYADCGVTPEPTAEQLADIAAATAENFGKITGSTPRVAFLSFSTKGSAKHTSAVKMRRATDIFLERHPEITADGELQADAAIVPEIAQRKSPDSPLKGKANVLIFPDLNAGNIAYKLTERLAGAQALGPIVQGLAKPYCDLSRGCSVSDIINITAIAAQMQ